MGLDQAMLFVKDLDRMTAFYRDVMGFEPVEETRLEDWVELRTGGAGLSLHAIPPHLAQSIEIPSPPRPRETQACKLIFGVEDLAAEQRRLSERGVVLLDRPWGGWEAVDPEGNVIGFRQT
jgi:catechol 2,3-dioxygenase-like lactoylglutathione lyase family enzyme